MITNHDLGSFETARWLDGGDVIRTPVSSVVSKRGKSVEKTTHEMVAPEWSLLAWVPIVIVDIGRFLCHASQLAQLTNPTF